MLVKMQEMFDLKCPTDEINKIFEWEKAHVNITSISGLFPDKPFSKSNYHLVFVLDGHLDRCWNGLIKQLKKDFDEKA